MKLAKPFLFLLAALLLLPLVGKTQGYDFRNIKWGMSMDEIKQSEKGNPCSSLINTAKNDCLCYDEQLGGKAYQLYYCFQEDKLESAAYKRFETNANLAAFADDFYALKKVLEDKYGENYLILKKESMGYGDYAPMTDSNKDLSTLFKRGDFVVQVIWEPTDRTRIILNFEALYINKGHTCNLSINYYPASKVLIYDNNAFSGDVDKL